MSIAVNNIQIDEFSNLGAKTQTILDLIPASASWFSKAITESSRQYQFSNETELLSTVLSGLHDSHCLYLKNVAIDATPNSLLQFDSNDLRDLYHYNQSSNVPEQYLQLLEKYSFIGNQTFEKMESLLSSWGVSESPIVKNASAYDKALLFQINPKVENYQFTNILATEADNFSLEHAASVDDYLYLLFFYYVVASGASLKKGSAETRINNINAVYAILSEIASNHLDALNFNAPPEQSELSSEISKFSQQGRSLGFCSINNGVFQIAQAISYASLEDALIEKAAIQYVDDANHFVNSKKASDASLSQQDNVWRYYFNNGQKNATVRLDNSLSLSLEQYSSGD